MRAYLENSVMQLPAHCSLGHRWGSFLDFFQNQIHDGLKSFEFTWGAVLTPNHGPKDGCIRTETCNE